MERASLQRWMTTNEWGEVSSQVYSLPDVTTAWGEDMQRVCALLALVAMHHLTAPSAAIAQVAVAGAETTRNPYAAADAIFADYVLGKL